MSVTSCIPTSSICSACSKPPPLAGDGQVTAATAAANAATAEAYDLADRSAYDDAARGFLGTIESAYLLLFTKLAALFALFGALYGAIIALDPTAPRVLAPWTWIQQVEARRVRTLVCGVLGTTAVWVASTFGPSGFSQAWLLLGTIAGAILGWYGWRWARYVDF